MDFKIVDFDSHSRGRNGPAINIFKMLGADDCEPCRPWFRHFENKRSPENYTAIRSELRTGFTLSTSIQSATSNCQGCHFRNCLVQGCLDAYNLRLPPGSRLYWDIVSFNLCVTEHGGTNRRAFQFFSVEGETVLWVAGIDAMCSVMRFGSIVRHA